MDSTLSSLAALFVLLVVFFPTASRLPDTWTQKTLGEPLVDTIHQVAAGCFIGSLAVISVFYGVREAARSQDAKGSPRFWKWFHWGCAIVIALAIAGIGLDWITGRGPRTTVLLGEALAIWAFGASWLTKGFEWKYLKRQFQQK